jgi:hypothetical protein
MKTTNSTTRPITPQSTVLTASTNATASGYRRCSRLSSPDASDRYGLRLLRHRYPSRPRSAKARSRSQ